MQSVPVFLVLLYHFLLILYDVLKNFCVLGLDFRFPFYLRVCNSISFVPSLSSLLLFNSFSHILCLFVPSLNLSSINKTSKVINIKRKLHGVKFESFSPSQVNNLLQNSLLVTQLTNQKNLNSLPIIQAFFFHLKQISTFYHFSLFLKKLIKIPLNEAPSLFFVADTE